MPSDEKGDVFRGLIESHPSAVLIVSGIRVIYCNPKGFELLGATVAEAVIGHSIQELVALEQQYVLKLHLIRAVKGQGADAVTIHLNRADSKPCIVTSRAVPFLYQGQKVVQLTWEDVTAAHLEGETRRLMVATVASSALPVFATDLEGKILTWNVAAETFYGYPASAAVGRSMFFLVPEMSRGDAEQILRGVRSWQHVQKEAKHVTRDGRVLDVSLAVSPLKNASGALDGASFFVYPAAGLQQRRNMPSDDELHVVVPEVTKQLPPPEKGLVRAEAGESSRMDDVFLSNLSREIRTPLTAILGFTELLAESAGAGEVRYAHMIQASGERLMKMLNEVVELAQLQHGSYAFTRTSFNLVDLVQEAGALFEKEAAEKNLTLTLDVPDSVSFMITSDRRALLQVVCNLLSNALKCTQEGRVVLSLSLRHTFVELRVADNGKGISDAYLPHLFEAFTQETNNDREVEGNGLGLALTRSLVEQLDGTIEVETAVGKGTTFTVILPNVVGKIDGGDAGADQRKAMPERVLIVQSNVITRRLMERVLKADYEVDSAGTEEEALALASSSLYDAVLLDISLSELQMGINVLHDLQRMEAYRYVPMIACTAHSMPGDEDRFAQAGFSAFLAKPYSKYRLQEAIARAFAADQTGRPSENTADEERHIEVPAPPETLTAVVKMLTKVPLVPDIEQLTKVLDRDPVTASWVLRYVNSSYYGLSKTVARIDHAVTLLGFEPVCNLILTGVLTRTFISMETPRVRQVYDYILNLSMGTAGFVQHLAEALNIPDREALFTGALLHQVGRLVLLSAEPEAYSELWYDEEDTFAEPLRSREMRAFRTDSVRLGAETARQWALDEMLITVISYQRNPDQLKDLKVRRAILLVVIGQAASRQLLYAPAFDVEALAADEQVLKWLKALADLCAVTVKDLTDLLEASTDSIRAFVKMTQKG